MDNKLLFFCFFLAGCSPSLTGFAVSGDLVLTASFDGDPVAAVVIRGSLTKIAFADLKLDILDWASGSVLASSVCQLSTVCEVNYQEPLSTSGQRIYRVRGIVMSGIDEGRSVEEVLSVPPVASPPADEQPQEQVEEQMPQEQQEQPILSPPPVVQVPPGPLCGNGIVEGDEECEGSCDSDQCVECKCVAIVAPVVPLVEEAPQVVELPLPQISVQELLGQEALGDCIPINCLKVFPGALTGCLRLARSEDEVSVVDRVEKNGEFLVRQRCPGDSHYVPPINTKFQRGLGWVDYVINSMLLLKQS